MKLKGNIFGIVVTILLLTACANEANHFMNQKPEKGKGVPGFHLQRTAHGVDINHEVYQKAIQQTMEERACNTSNTTIPEWETVGPFNIGGRITDIEMHHCDSLTVYVGAASGGVFKLINQGESWDAVFDGLGSMSIGDIALAPTDKKVIYVGTGEANAGGGSITYDGRGIFKSVDEGKHWQHMGLEKTRNIGRIIVDPYDANKVYVAAMGNLFANNRERGIFKSQDGGRTWQHSLYVSDSTGCVDLVMHPNNPNVLYASMWERVRRVDYRKYGGATSGIYFSNDGGQSWRRMFNGLPQDDIGRIGLAIAASNPNVLYAIYADETGYFKGVYKTLNGGQQWFKVYDTQLKDMYLSYGWWFGNIRVDPNDEDIVFALGLDTYRSENGGLSWENVSKQRVHYDQHAMYIHPSSGLIMLGNDGGLYASMDGGDAWYHYPYLPITQFYSCTFHPHQKGRLLGGCQDNGIIQSPNQGQEQWEKLIEGDGMKVIVDPQDARYVYAAYQYGALSRSIDGGQTFQSITHNGINPEDRRNWNTPVTLDPNQPNVLYYGTNRLYRSTDRGTTWQAVTPSFWKEAPQEKHIDARLSPIVYRTITVITVAPSDSRTIYVGTDDGQVLVTYDGGKSWQHIDHSLPNRWVTAIAVDANNPRKAYLSFSGYRQAEPASYVFHTLDGGFSWTDISGNLPPTPVNDILMAKGRIYVATDVGVYRTDSWDLRQWELVGKGLPIVPINGLAYEKASQTLAAATYGRSIYVVKI